MHKQKGSVYRIYVFLMSVFFIGLVSIGDARAADGTLSGHVYEADGTTSIAGIKVIAEDISTEVFSVVSTEADFSVVNTDAEGSYSLTLPAASYRIKVAPSWTDRNYADEYFDGAPHYGLASEVAVIADQNIPLIDFTLEQGGNISGSITTDPPVDNFDTIQVIVRAVTAGHWVNSCSVSSDGSYVTPNLLPGDYAVEFTDSSGQLAGNYYSPTPVTVTEGNITPNINIVLTPGGTISGTITTESQIDNYDTIQVVVSELSEQWGNFCSVNSDGSYTKRLIPGDYIISFEDASNQFQTEFYNQSPVSSQATHITVTEGSTTSNIDVLLKNVTDDRYYIDDGYCYTFHSYDNTTMTTKTMPLMYVSVSRFSDQTGNWRETIKSDFLITAPSGTYTENEYEVDNTWRLKLNDDNHNGIIEDSERADPYAQSELYKWCNLGDTPHDAGDYIINATLSDGTTLLSRTVNVEQAGRTLAELPPVTDLAASWDDTDNELDVSWVLPATPYPAETFLQIRLFLYNNGHYLNNPIRVQDLPVTLTQFTIDSDTTVNFDTGLVDQIVVDVRVYVEHTITETKQAYSFSSETGVLTEAPITMKLLDVDGDKRTGLAEAIYSLKAVSGE